MNGAAVVLLSGGLDSTVALFWASRRYAEVHAVSFDYGQRHRTELEAARQIALTAGVTSWSEHELPMGRLGIQSDLTHGTPGAPIASRGGLQDDDAPDGLPRSFVPGLSHLMLSFAGVRAAAVRGDVVFGLSADVRTPDTAPEFVQVTGAAVNLGLPDELRPVAFHAPLLRYTKAAVVKMAHDLGPACWTAIAFAVSCYQGERPGCGQCEACRRRIRGFEALGYDDPGVERWGPRETGWRDPNVKVPTIPGDA